MNAHTISIFTEDNGYRKYILKNFIQFVFRVAQPYETGGAATGNHYHSNKKSIKYENMDRKLLKKTFKNINDIIVKTRV